jgi:hypothetical protein
LQRRDLEILETLVIRRAETLDELHRLAFAGRSRKRVLNRLGELAAAGYVQRTRMEVLGSAEPQSVYTLGPRAKRAIELRSLASEHFLHRRFNPILRDSSIPHQIATNRVADWLGAQLVPEHLLPSPGRDAARHRPDGVYRCQPHPSRSGDLVFLEVDLGHYSRERILGKLRSFQQSPDARLMLFVCPDDARKAKLLAWLGPFGAGQSPSIDVMTFEEVRAGRRPGRSYSRSNAVRPCTEPPDIGPPVRR